MPVARLSFGPMHYLDQGAGPLVVLLHGVIMAPSVWDQVLPLLPTGFCYLRPLLPLGSHREPMRPAPT